MNSFSGEASDKVILTDSLVVPLTEVQVYEQTLETAMAHRPELRIAANQVAIQQSAARIANSRYLPKLSVGETEVILRPDMTSTQIWTLITWCMPN